MSNVLIRKRILEMVNRGKASHIGSALSMVEILNAIFNLVDLEKIIQQSDDRDRVILSKGHGTSGLYAVMYHHGLLNDEEIKRYFKDGSKIEGHASHFVRNVEHSTGALGHGLPVGLGIALGCRSRKFKNQVYVVVGDGELHEGSNWEAMMYAGQHKLENLYILIDKNERSQMGNTADACSIEPLYDKLIAFNLHVCEVDGHEQSMIESTILQTKHIIKPKAIMKNTIN